VWHQDEIIVIPILFGGTGEIMQTLIQTSKLAKIVSFKQTRNLVYEHDGNNNQQQLVKLVTKYRQNI
jgi:hypothetical protein